MISLLSRLNSSVSIEAELDIEVNKLAFHLSVADNAAILSVDRWKDALSLAKHVATDSISYKRMLAALDSELKRINITVYMRNRNIAVIGPKANPVYAFIIKKFIPLFIVK